MDQYDKVIIKGYLGSWFRGRIFTIFHITRDKEGFLKGDRPFIVELENHRYTMAEDELELY